MYGNHTVLDWLPPWSRSAGIVKTDRTRTGPEPGKPAIVGAGMVGDRASVIFASPEEIGAFIAAGC